MSKKTFTKSEISTLSNNKYVKKVSDKGITYTEEFRKDYINLLKDGKNMYEAFSELGFDTTILGFSRIDSFHNRMKTYIKNNKPYRDLRSTNSGRKKIEFKSYR